MTTRFSARFARTLAAVSVLAAASAQAMADSKAYVANAKDNTVSVIDLKAGKVVATVPVATGPHGIAVSPDGRRVYVSGDGSSSVTVLDGRTDQVVHTMDVGNAPHGDRLTPDGKTLLVAINGEDRVAFVDTDAQTVVAKTEVTKPHTIAIAPGGKEAYVASQAPGHFSLAVLDLTSHSVTRTIPLEKSPRDLEFGQDGKLYFTEAGINAVEVLDPAAGRVVAEIPTGPSPHIANYFPGAKVGTVVVQGQGELALFDPSTDKLVRHVGVGKQPHWVAVSGDGKLAYVTDEGSNDVSVVDLVSGQVRKTIAVGNAPRKVAIGP